jgi:hypothetical protein
MKYVISIDTDWATDEILQYTLDILKEYRIPATFFLTNPSKVNLEGHESAIHPNFTSLDYDFHIKERMDFCKNVIGTRSHSLFFTERLRPVYKQWGIKYQSNVMLYLQDDIKPFLISPDTLEIPLFFMDTFHLIMTEPETDFDIQALRLEYDGLKVFDFHPIHVFLNTNSLSLYDRAKPFYHDATALKEIRNNNLPGTETLFRSLLNYIREHGYFGTLEDVYNLTNSGNIE